MSGEAALTKFKTRLAAWLTGQIGSGVDVFIDRPFDEPFRDADLPCINIRVPECSYEIFGYNGWLHSASVAFDLIAGSSASQSVNASQAEIQAAIVARIAAAGSTPGELGELLTAQNNGLLATPLSTGQQQDEYGLSDHGEAVFAWRFAWLTPSGDFRTVVGQNGLIP